MATDADRGPWIGIGCSVGVFAASESWRQALRRCASHRPPDTAAGPSPANGSACSAAGRPGARAGAGQSRHRTDQRDRRHSIGCRRGRQSSRRSASSVAAPNRRGTSCPPQTVAARLAHVAEQMGWDFDDPMDRFMAHPGADGASHLTRRPRWRKPISVTGPTFVGPTPANGRLPAADGAPPRATMASSVIPSPEHTPWPSSTPNAPGNR